MTAKPFRRELDFDPLEVPREQMGLAGRPADCPCVPAGCGPRFYCWVAAPDCPHGKPSIDELRDGKGWS